MKKQGDKMQLKWLGINTYKIEIGQFLFNIYSNLKGELNYALSLSKQVPHIIQIENCE